MGCRGPGSPGAHKDRLVVAQKSLKDLFEDAQQRLTSANAFQS
jgi:hypothetical protein